MTQPENLTKDDKIALTKDDKIALTKDDKIALTLRGHIRDSFDNDKLYNFLKKLTTEYDVDIYIYTFNIKNAGKIYKCSGGEPDYQKVAEIDVLNYIKDMSKYVKKIIINENHSAKSENEIILGTISKNKFLHMWQSIYNIIKYVKSTNIKYDYVINMRLDYFQVADRFPNSKCSSEMRKLFYIDIFDNFLKKIDKRDKFCLANINFDNVVKLNKNPFNSKSIDFFKKKREQRINFLSKIDIIHHRDDILYGIDNLFAGHIDYLFGLSYIFVYQMNIVFDFLTKIIFNLSRTTKAYGGCGGPHESVLPLFVKNKLGYYLENDCVISFDSSLNISLDYTIQNLLTKNVKILDNRFNTKYNSTAYISATLELFEFLKTQEFKSFYEIGCGFGIVFYIINELFKDKIASSLAFDNFHSPINEYINENTNKFCRIVETLVNFGTHDLLFFNEPLIKENKFTSLMENSKIIIFNGMYPENLTLLNFAKKIYPEILYTIIGNNQVSYHIIIK
jgi:hypothetical protein